MSNTMKKIINRQGKALAVQVEGLDNAAVIIFSNSLGTDHTMWDEQAAYFNDNYKVIRYDTRGHGQSEIIEDSTLENLGEDVIDILDYLNISKAHFCGISMGGITGLWLAANAADRFETITVANSAAKIGHAEAWLARADQIEKEGSAELVKTTHSRWFSEQFDYQHDALAQQTIHSLAETPARGYALACRALAYADIRNDLDKISAAILVICGEKDPVTTIQDGEFIQTRIQNGQLATLDASHLSNIERPDEFNQILNKFIS